jgi:hypothetical protein
MTLSPQYLMPPVSSKIWRARLILMSPRTFESRALLRGDKREGRILLISVDQRGLEKSPIGLNGAYLLF